MRESPFDSNAIQDVIQELILWVNLSIIDGPDWDGLKGIFQEALGWFKEELIDLIDVFNIRDEDTNPIEDIGIDTDSIADLAGSPAPEKIGGDTSAKTFAEYSSSSDAGISGVYSLLWEEALPIYNSFEIIGQSLIALYIAILVIFAGTGYYNKSRIVVKIGRCIAALTAIAIGPTLFANLMAISNQIAVELIVGATTAAPGELFSAGGVTGLLVGAPSVGILLATGLGGLVVSALIFWIIALILAEIAVVVLFTLFPLLMGFWVFGGSNRVTATFTQFIPVILPTIFLNVGLALVYWATVTMTVSMLKVEGGIDVFLAAIAWFLAVFGFFAGTYVVLKSTWIGSKTIAGVTGVAKTVTSIGLAAATAGAGGAAATASSAGIGGASAAQSQAAGIAGKQLSQLGGDGLLASNSSDSDEDRNEATEAMKDGSDGGRKEETGSSYNFGTSGNEKTNQRQTDRNRTSGRDGGYFSDTAMPARFNDSPPQPAQGLFDTAVQAKGRYGTATTFEDGSVSMPPQGAHRFGAFFSQMDRVSGAAKNQQIQFGQLLEDGKTIMVEPAPATASELTRFSQSMVSDSNLSAQALTNINSDNSGDIGKVIGENPKSTDVVDLKENEFPLTVHKTNV